MSKKPESIFAEQVDKDLKKTFGDKVFFENIQQVVKAGTPDRLCCIKGHFVALELKTEEGRLSKIQKLKLAKITNAGGLAYVVKPSTWEHCLKELKRLKKIRS